MKTNITFSTWDLKLLYIQYKKYLINFLIIFVSIVIFGLVIPSQITTLFLLRDDAEKIKEHIKILSDNVTLLSKENEQTLSENLKLATKVLPDTKDFEGITSSVSSAGLSSGVSISDYGFEVGDVSLISFPTKTSYLSVGLTIDGGVLGLQRFIKELSHVYPVSEITELQTSNTTSQLTIQFYFKPFPNATEKKDNPLPPLSKSEAALLGTLSNSVNNKSVGISTVSATGSAF